MFLFHVSSLTYVYWQELFHNIFLRVLLILVDPVFVKSVFVPDVGNMSSWGWTALSPGCGRGVL